MSRLVLVRHGRSVRNAAGELSGRDDVPLDAEGRRQATALGDALSGLEGARVVSSPLRRARETAEALGRPVETDDRWIELDYGDLEGCRVAEVPGDTWRRWRGDVDFAPRGGESFRALGARVRSACEDLRERDTDVVVVSHVSPIKSAVAWALGVGDEISWRLYLGTASISRVDLRGPSLLVWNDLHHLEG